MARRASGFVERVADGDNTAHQLRKYLFVFNDINLKRVEGSSALIRRAHKLHPLGISPWHRATPTELSRPNRRWGRERFRSSAMASSRVPAASAAAPLSRMKTAPAPASRNCSTPVKFSGRHKGGALR